MTCITTLNHSLKDGTLTAPPFLLVTARILFPLVMGRFRANLKMRKYLEELHMMWHGSPLLSVGALLLTVGGDDALSLDIIAFDRQTIIILFSLCSCLKFCLVGHPKR